MKQGSTRSYPWRAAGPNQPEFQFAEVSEFKRGAEELGYSLSSAGVNRFEVYRKHSHAVIAVVLKRFDMGVAQKVLAQLRASAWGGVGSLKCAAECSGGCAECSIAYGNVWFVWKLFGWNCLHFYKSGGLTEQCVAYHSGSLEDVLL